MDASLDNGRSFGPVSVNGRHVDSWLIKEAFRKEDEKLFSRTTQPPNAWHSLNVTEGIFSCPFH